MTDSEWLGEGGEPRRKAELKTRFDRIFTRRTGFATLDRLLARLHANRAELLRVLDRPDIPLHTNGSENDIRCQVIRRKVSGTSRSDPSRDCRDAFLGLAKTCRKLGISFWDYLGAHLGAAVTEAIPSLADIVAPAHPWESPTESCVRSIRLFWRNPLPAVLPGAAPNGGAKGAGWHPPGA